MATLGTIPSNSTLTSADVSDFTEAVQDTLSTTLVAGTGISFVYNDAANTYTINSTGGGGGGSIAVADTNSVDMTWDGTTLSAVIPTAATPQVARMAVGGTLPATTVFAVPGQVAIGNVDGIKLGSTSVWNAQAGGSTGQHAVTRVSLHTDAALGGGGFSNGVNGRGLGANNDNTRFAGVNLFNQSTYWFPTYSAHTFDSKGLLAVHQVTLNHMKPAGTTAPSNYSEAATYVGGVLCKNRGSLSEVMEFGLTSYQGDATRTGESGYHVDGGPAVSQMFWGTQYEHNSYSDFNNDTLYGGAVFEAGNVIRTTGGRGYVISSQGSRRVGTGLYFHSGAQVADEAGGESGFVRVMVLRSTTGAEIWTLDGFGRMGFGVTRDQTNNTAGLPAYITLGTGTTPLFGIQFGEGANAANLYRSANDTLKTDDSFVVGTNLTVTGTATFNGNTTIVGAFGVSSSIALSGTNAFGFIEACELSSDPAAPAANKGRWFFKDNGAGKTQFAVRFPTGAVQILATEP